MQEPPLALLLETLRSALHVVLPVLLTIAFFSNATLDELARVLAVSVFVETLKSLPRAGSRMER